jgi:hypothetical protein
MCRVLSALAKDECADPSRDGNGEQYGDPCQHDPQPADLTPAFVAAGRDELTLERVQLRGMLSRPIEHSRKPRPSVKLGRISPARLPLA